jgi:hypothetical protein
MQRSTSRSNQRLELSRESRRPTGIDRCEGDEGDAGLSTNQTFQGESIDLRSPREAGAGYDWRTLTVDVGECNAELTFNTWLGTQVEWKGDLGDVAGPWVQAWIPPEAGERPLEFGLPQQARMALPRPKVAMLTADWADPDELKKAPCNLSKRSVFIEMGQGLIAGHLTVLSSALWSCLFIAGRNSRTGLAGAYHYPAMCLHDSKVWGDLLAWQAALQPDEVVVLKPLLQLDAWKSVLASGEDLKAVTAWAKRDGASVRVESVGRPFMSHARDQFEVGDADRKGLGDAQVTLASCLARDYSDKERVLMRLIGRDRTKG